MKQFIRVLLFVENQPCKEVEVESTRVLHEVEVYAMLEKMFPAYLSLSTDVEDMSGYALEYKNKAYSVAIYRSTPTGAKEEFESGVYSTTLED